MNREDIERIATDAGIVVFGEAVLKLCTLVAAAEREKLQRDGWRQCATGQRTTQYCGLLRQAVEAEREACAKVCDALPFLNADQCATAIRMRGEAK